jgi:hypothetical protein
MRKIHSLLQASGASNDNMRKTHSLFIAASGIGLKHQRKPIVYCCKLPASVTTEQANAFLLHHKVWHKTKVELKEGERERERERVVVDCMVRDGGGLYGKRWWWIEWEEMVVDCTETGGEFAERLVLD